MAAKEIMIFLPRGTEVVHYVEKVADCLALEVEQWSSSSGVPHKGAATKGRGRDILRVEYAMDGAAVIAELSQWDMPSDKYKKLLSGCEPYIALHYRRAEIARPALLAIAALEANLDQCVVENGLGCLLTLSSLIESLLKDENWSWERERFPELADVAPSEWIVSGEGE